MESGEPSQGRWHVGTQSNDNIRSGFRYVTWKDDHKDSYEHAMAMLKEGTETVEKVGQSVGYESLVSFSRAFKNYLGMSPGAYRKKSKE